MSPPRSFSRVGEVLPGVLSDLRLEAPLAAQAAVERFAAVAGERLSRHVRAVAVHDGVLVLQAEASVWAAEVRHQERRLLALLREACGADLVRSIRCVLRRQAWKE
jgi:predicted nucleic acid-binding Zn ribbon protein